MAKQSARPAPSLKTFVFEKSKAKCPICKVSKDIRAQLGTAAANAGISRPVQLTWLQKVAPGGSKLTMDDLNKHLNARHDRDEGFDNG